MLGALFALGIGGCKRKEQAPPAPAPPVAPSADHLAKGEIPEGPERAFTLPLPLHSKVKARFGASVHVASPHTHEELANFVRTRVKDGETSTSGNETRFDRVLVTKDPSRALTIEIRPGTATGGDYRSQMVINDVTPPPDEPGLTTEDRYRKAGLTPDGKLLDRKHLQ